ncbi:MAG: glutathione peroxidase [Rhodospirillaceae bacterium]|nr:MAG: glutathione peroxidase [Rhodospirillaceae bacterium]
MPSIYEISTKRIDGAATKLDAFKGKAMLIVNVASKCGLTPQYEGLEKLHEKYAGRGLAVLGFPANEFGAQEPGTNAEIKDFCTTKYNVTFPMFEKIVVKGEGQHPLYKALTTAQPKAQGDVAGMKARLESYGMKTGRDDEILWNFEKFLVDRKGDVVARFAPSTPPDDPALVGAIEKVLG